MRGRRLIGVLMTLMLGWSSAALAQDDYATEYDYLPATEEQKEGRTVLFTPEHVDVRELLSVLKLTNADIEVKPSLNLIAARSADEAELETIRRIVETLDVAPEPKANVELTAYILASSSSDSAPAVPADLAEEAGALAARFDADALRLLDSIFLRVGDGSGGRVEGSFPSGGVDQLSGYQFHFESAIVSRRGDEQMVQLDALTFVVTGENPAGVQRAMLRTDVEVRAGEKAMVGKATPKGVDDTLILLVTAEVKGPQ